ncbi:juvenile hormone esterase-like [Planococcus citri]|uniref:juvenile hormone esterase-like n=1 Tax=Planococcus citri TaxID=170843 RepID=UPI0031F970EE
MIVKMKNTTINGVENTCKLSGFPYFSYLGIPYAKPPIGNLRFQPPQKPDELEEEFDATLEGDDCIQMSRSRPGTIGSEDCLYVNVYVPKTEDNDRLKPVLVYAHGGLFTYFSGSSNYFSPDYVLPHDVIVVTINYRLHVLGFLDLGLPDSPGNVGLKDLILALQWVKENIECFGGDPNKITAGGNSCGAALLHLLTFSPATKDMNLFQQLVMFSGNALMRPAVTNSVERAFEFGHRLGYRGKNKEGLLKFLKNVPADELVEGLTAYHRYLQLENGGDIIVLPFSPSVETIEEGAIITAETQSLADQSVKLPTFTGLMSKEGMFAFYLDPFVMNHLREDFTTCVGRMLPMINDKILPEVADMIKLYYFKNKDIDFNSGKETIDLYTDVIWTRAFYDLSNFKDVNEEKWPVFVFHFLYEGPLNCYKKYYPVITRLMDGPTHDDILGYILPFKSDIASRFSSKRDIKVIKNLSALFCNFIKTGNPNGDNVSVNWKPFSQDQPNFLQIHENMKMCNGYINEDRYKFWLKINKIIKEGKIENNETEEE